MKAGLFDESLRSSEDFDLWLRVISSGGTIGYHRKPLVRSRLRRGSLSANGVSMCQHIVRVLDKTAKRDEADSRRAGAHCAPPRRVRGVATTARGPARILRRRIHREATSLDRSQRSSAAAQARARPAPAPADARSAAARLRPARSSRFQDVRRDDDHHSRCHPSRIAFRPRPGGRARRAVRVRSELGALSGDGQRRARSAGGNVPQSNARADTLAGLTFPGHRMGSGLFSLAARRLGATCIRSTTIRSQSPARAS